MKKLRSGFSLIEVLVFISVLGLFFTAAMAVTTFNLQSMKIQEHKILATRFAEEGIEWVKDEKETDWSIFITHDTGTGTMYCLNSLEDDWGTLGDCGETYSLGSPTFFLRNLLIKNAGNPVDQVDATITVEWKEGSDIKNVQIKSVFKLLE